MDKLKTFLIYVLIIVGFYFLSEFLTGQLIQQMYRSLDGSIDNNLSYNGQKLDVGVSVLDAKATNMNGYLKVRVKNNSDVPIDKAYLKLDLFANDDVKAISRYMKITNLNPGESRDYTLKFNAGFVDKYKVAVKEEDPDEDYKFEIGGYEFNTRNFLGIDISKYVDASSIKSRGGTIIGSIFGFFGKVAHRFVVTASSVPWWGYVGALAFIGGII